MFNITSGIFVVVIDIDTHKRTVLWYVVIKTTWNNIVVSKNKAKMEEIINEN